MRPSLRVARAKFTRLLISLNRVKSIPRGMIWILPGGAIRLTAISLACCCASTQMPSVTKAMARSTWRMAQAAGREK